MFSDNNSIKVEIKNRKITGNSPDTWKLKTLLNNPSVKEVSKEIRKYIEKNTT